MQVIQFYLHCSHDLILWCDNPNPLFTTGGGGGGWYREQDFSKQPQLYTL